MNALCFVAVREDVDLIGVLGHAQRSLEETEMFPLLIQKTNRNKLGTLQMRSDCMD